MTPESALVACAVAESSGRPHPEPPADFRSPFVRDRDRVLHSSAFRRLLGKTQVFVGQPDDNQRTRLTHTLEVSGIARTCARNLGLNEDLVETLALAHDIGHAPFGHGGERALAALMAGRGGFEHNAQALRIVDRLETRYPHFPGLNLTHEVRRTLAGRGRGKGETDPLPGLPPRLVAEGQLVDMCDSIAYDAHDIDDALRAGLLRTEDLADLDLWCRAEERVARRYGTGLELKQRVRAALRALIDLEVRSLLATSAPLLAGHDAPASVAAAAFPSIALAEPLADEKARLQKFLFARVYRHPQVMGQVERAQDRLQRLFADLADRPARLPRFYRDRLAEDSTERVVCDYLAGMTDRYADRLATDLFA